MDKRLTIEDLLNNRLIAKTYYRTSKDLDPYRSVEIRRVKSGINFYMGVKSGFGGKRYSLCQHPASKNILYFVEDKDGLKFKTPRSDNARPILQLTNSKTEIVKFLENKLGVYHLHYDVNLNVNYINFDEKEQADE